MQSVGDLNPFIHPPAAQNSVGILAPEFFLVKVSMMKLPNKFGIR